jgi:hypothetical protein
LSMNTVNSSARYRIFGVSLAVGVDLLPNHSSWNI